MSALLLQETLGGGALVHSCRKLLCEKGLVRHSSRKLSGGDVSEAPPDLRLCSRPIPSRSRSQMSFVSSVCRAV